MQEILELNFKLKRRRGHASKVGLREIDSVCIAVVDLRTSGQTVASFAMFVGRIR